MTAAPTGREVLVVVDDPELEDLLSTTLALAGYQVGRAGSGAEGLARVIEHRFDLVVFDATLPDLPDLAKRRRLAAADRPPVLFLTTCDALESLLPELGGGEDYVTKPFRITEVLARAKVLLRRRDPVRPAGALHHGDLVLDGDSCRASRAGRPLELTAAEYRLLHHLVLNAGTVLSKEQIAERLWGEFRGDNAIERLVSRLRGKVDREEPALIHTRRGFGYCLGGPRGAAG